MLSGEDKPGLSPIRMMEMVAFNKEPISSAIATLPWWTKVRGAIVRCMEFSFGINDFSRGMAC